MCLRTVILYCLLQINGDRSIYSIFHIIKGKKSSQTIQDSHLFHIAVFFQSYQFVTRDKFEEVINYFISRNWLKEMQEQHYQLTPLGKAELEKQMIDRPIPTYLNGLTYQSLTEPFWERLSLLVQVCSNLVHKQSHYIPIQRKYEIQTWLKTFLAHLSNSRKELAQQLHGELVFLLEKEKSLEPSAFVIRLTGHNQIGLTAQQAAVYLNQEYSYYHLQFLNIVHFMLGGIEQDSLKFPLLSLIIQDLKHPFPFTTSTMKTYELLRRGVEFEKIAQIRKLKQSTIEDHIVEIAFNDKQFNISPFVSIAKQTLILKAAKQIGSKQLKQIRKLTTDVNYFEIRLVIAKYGER